MKIDKRLGDELVDVEATARQAEAEGYAGVWTAEAGHDPFLPLLLAAEHTTNIEVGTSIAVAFARNPMTLANSSWDLQTYSRGRFILGLGSQIKAHVTNRFSMEWSHPAARMREMVCAIRAIWDCWLNGTKLDFRGDFYHHTLMTPFFTPSAHVVSERGVPKVFLAGVGEMMTMVAGEVCDGFICHGFTTERYLRERILPALAAGRAKAGKSMEGFEVVGPSFVVTGSTEEEYASAASATRQRLAFYGSTPAYRNVLALHGWGELQEELTLMSKAGRWKDMGRAITDDILRSFAVVGEPPTIARELVRRYGDVVDRLSFYAPYEANDAMWAGIISDLEAQVSSE